MQGLTLDEIVVNMKGGHFTPGQVYVAFSRVKKLIGLHICDFNESAIKKSPSVEAEMSRLKPHLLPSTPNLKCASLPDFYVTIKLLNVRSINAKVQDIVKDKMLKYASVLCFCETWLNPSQPDPKLLDNHTVMRTDRDANNSKGGVMMSIDNTKNVQFL